MAVISQTGRTLAEHVSLIRLADFAVAFSLTWIAWTNGSLYLELHGRSDGRTGAYVFVQMGIVAILAVFAGDAGNRGGSAFAITYAALLAVMTWLWYTVRRQDVIERAELLVDTGRYVVAIAATAWLLAGAVAVGLIALIVTSRALADAGRLAAVYRPLEIAMAGGAVVTAVIGLVRPAPWRLATARGGFGAGSGGRRSGLSARRAVEQTQPSS